MTQKPGSRSGQTLGQSLLNLFPQKGLSWRNAKGDEDLQSPSYWNNSDDRFAQ